MAGKSTRKGFSLEHAFLEELTDARRKFSDDENELLWSVLNGHLAEGVFLQMVARAGMEAIANSDEARKAMWSYLPSSARGYRP